MLMIDINNLRKSYGDRVILDIENLKLYSKDKVGIVGNNGSGKTTLLKLLGNIEEVDSGTIRLNGEFRYVSQLDEPENRIIGGEMASKFNIPIEWSDSFSGGEKTRYKLAEAMDMSGPMLFVDEPTNNLDIDGIDLIKKRLEEYKGLLLIVSHDRSLLDAVCNKILEVEDGRVNLYNGNYSDYKLLKEEELARDKFEYDEYIREKKRLEEAMLNISNKSEGVRTTPKRMGNSEARLHKMGGQNAKKNLDEGKKAIRSRLEQLEIKESPKEEKEIKLKILDGSQVHSKLLLSGKNINKSFGDKLIFKDAEFDIYNASKVGLIGPNGSGKTSLIDMIINKEGIRHAPALKLGYFSQDMDILDESKSIIENVMETSGFLEEFARLLLARLLFRGDDIYKKVGDLSGGERVKLSLAKILLEDTNMLILDEPTNYLDISSLEVLEDTLINYDKTLLIVSHDREFLSRIVDEILFIEDNKLNRFIGSYEDYADRNRVVERDNTDDIIILENRLNSIIGRLSMPNKDDNIEELDEEYKLIIKKLNILKNS